MAIYHATMKSFSRGNGDSSVAAAAYRAGFDLLDTSTGLGHNYSHRGGVDFHQMLAPKGAPSWCFDAQYFWNANEAAETRKNARVCREVEVSLPHQLDPHQRRVLALALGQLLVERFQVAVLVAVHTPSKLGDQRNHHVHLLMSARQVGPGGLGERACAEFDARQGGGTRALRQIRRDIATVINAHLKNAGNAARVDHRSLRAQAQEAARNGEFERARELTRRPGKHLGKAKVAVMRYTVPGKNGKSIITVNELESAERQRFTICHEIAHVVLGLPSKHEEVPQWGYAKRDPNEVFCDVFASELLMPYKEWLASVPKDEPSLALIEQMAVRFGTSFPAAASRYASLTDYPCAFVTMERGVVRYSVLSKALREVKAWIPPRASIPSGSVTYRLRELGGNGTDSDWVPQDIWFENWEKGLELCEIGRHFSLRDTTTSLLWFDQEELPEVEHDRFGKRWEDDGGLPELTGELTWGKGTRHR